MIEPGRIEDTSEGRELRNLLTPQARSACVKYMERISARILDLADRSSDEQGNELRANARGIMCAIAAFEDLK